MTETKKTIIPSKPKLPNLDEKQVNLLFTKQAKLFKKYVECPPFDQPCLILLRRNQTGTFHEGVTKGVYEFTHSDGRPRRIEISDNRKYQLPIGKEKSFQVMIGHEDVGMLLPEDPYLLSEYIMIAHETVLTDIHKWKTKELNEKGKMFKTIALSILIVVGGTIAILLLWKLLLPDIPYPWVTNTAKTIIQNMTTNTTH